MSYAFNQVASDTEMTRSVNRRASGDSLLADSFDQRAIDIDAAIEKLHQIMKPKATGWCARHVRQALEAGGADMTLRPRLAREYRTKLIELGFAQVEIGNGYIPQRGDVAVFESYENQRHQAGHIQMFDGSSWVSDFKQANFLPHRLNYRGVAYEIFRP
jgi:hypothetical protein